MRLWKKSAAAEPDDDWDYRASYPEESYSTSGPMPVVIIGYGGHAQDIAAIARRAGFAAEHVSDRWARMDAIIGVNDPQTRAEIIERWSEPDRVQYQHFVTSTASYSPDYVARALTDPSASTDGSTFGSGCVVGPGSQVLDSKIGAHVHVNGQVFAVRCVIGDFTTVAPGVKIAGDVTIGKRCLIGIGASVSNLLTIGDDVTVGAGAVVVNDVPDGATVKGIPAR